MVSEKVCQTLLENEVLKKCEGVGRLLLRQPGEAISMNTKFREFYLFSLKYQFNFLFLEGTSSSVS